jgi:hypothetical protein
LLISSKIQVNSLTLSYQIKGTAKYITDGELVDTFKAMVEKMFNGAATAKGVLIITPEKVIVTTPGADNKKEI